MALVPDSRTTRDQLIDGFKKMFGVNFNASKTFQLRSSNGKCAC